MLLFVLACAKAPSPTPPEPPPAAPAEAPALAPRLFDAPALRDGFVLGTDLRLRIETAGERPVIEHWQVTGHTPAGCTIRTATLDAETGAVVVDWAEGTSTWEELEGHASFPAARTTLTDETTTVPAGTFETRRYTVTDEDGTVRVLDFAKKYPGPPVSMVVSRDGQVVMSMVLLERTQP